MSVTTRNLYTEYTVGYTLVGKGSVTGATTKVSFVFTATNDIYGIVQGHTINVYVNGSKKTLSWTTNKTATFMGTTYQTKMTSAVLTVSLPFFDLKIAESDGTSLYEGEFSFYDVEKAAGGAVTSGGTMDGVTASKVTFATSSTDATYQATFVLGDYTGSATSTTKELTYVIPIEWNNALPNDRSGNCIVTGNIYYGGKLYRTVTCILTVWVPVSLMPTITSVNLADKADTPVPASWEIFVQHQSGLRVTAIDCAGIYGSTIETIKLEVEGQSISMDYDPTNLPVIETVTSSGLSDCSVSVIDSRGRRATKSALLNFVAYASPKFTAISSVRCNASGEEDNDGTYFLNTSTVNYSTCYLKNSINLSVQYKKTDVLIYSDAEVITPGTNVCGNGQLDTEFSYDVLYTLSDQFTTVTFTDYVSTATYLMHFLHGGKGVAFGHKATLEEYVDCAFKALFRDDVFFVTGNGQQVEVKDIITLGTQTLTSFGNGLYLCAQDGKLVASVPTIGSNTPTSFTNGQFLYASGGKLASKTPTLADVGGNFKAGDFLSMEGVVSGGFLTTSSKEVYFDIFLPKPVTATAVSISAGKVSAIRTISGYAYTKSTSAGGVYSNILIASLSPACTLNKEAGSVRICLTNSGAWTTSTGTAIANNTPMSIHIASLTLRFS